MSADDVVRDIRWTLEKIHKLLYKVDKHVELAVPEADRVSVDLERILADVTREAHNIRGTTVDIVSYVSFPK